MKGRYLFPQKSLRSGFSLSPQMMPYDWKKNYHKGFIYMYRLTHSNFHLIEETYEERAFRIPLTLYLFLIFRNRGLVLYSVGS